jgi:hypothetical protein
MSDQPEPTIGVTAFIRKLRGTADEVYSRLLQIEHRFENKTVADWHAALHEHRGLPPVAAVPGAPAPAPSPDVAPPEGT